MPRYIEADALMVAFDDADLLTPEIMSVVEDAPSANVAPVVLGAWELMPGEHIHWCSVCHEEPHKAEHGYEILSKHCPNCGARMEDT